MNDEKVKVKVTISRQSSSVGDQSECMSISIKDEESTLQIAEVKMTLHDFAEAATGLAMVPATMTKFVGDKARLIGRRRVNETVLCDSSMDKDSQRALVDMAFDKFQKNHPEHEWNLFSDGTMTKQTGGFHRFIVCRYEKSGE